MTIRRPHRRHADGARGRTLTRFLRRSLERRGRRWPSARAAATVVAAACLITLGPPADEPGHAGGRLAGFDIPLPPAVVAVDGLAREGVAAGDVGAEGYPAFRDYPSAAATSATVAGSSLVGQQSGSTAATAFARAPRRPASGASAANRRTPPGQAASGAAGAPLRRAGQRSLGAGTPTSRPPTTRPAVAAQGDPRSEPATTPTAPGGPPRRPGTPAPAAPSPPSSPIPPTSPPSGGPPPATEAPPPPVDANPGILDRHVGGLTDVWAARARPDGASADWDEAAALGLWWALVEHCTAAGGASTSCTNAADAVLGGLAPSRPDGGRWATLPADGRLTGYNLARGVLGSAAVGGDALPAVLPGAAGAPGSAAS